MVRFAGIKNNRIYVVSDHIITNSELQIIEVPEELSHILSKDLIVSGKVKNNQIVIKLKNKPAKDIKLALVGNWKMRCGISTYAENLWPEIVKHVGDYKLFIEENIGESTGPLNQMGTETIADDKISVCWKRGESLQKLIEELKEYDPDIIYASHEYGLFPNARRWLSLMSQLSDYRIIVTMHSIFHHKDKTICEAAMPEIISHLQGGHDVLKFEKKIPSKVHVIPHGCYLYTGEKLWNFYKSNHTFITQGFGFKYKRFEYCIEAVALLKEKYPDAFFTALFSESEYNKTEHQIYYNELFDLVNELGVQENVALIKGYQSDETINSYLNTNKVSVFPYGSNPEHEVFGASGAARLAMSKGIPVISSSVNHFSDLPTIKADTPEKIAEELDRLFSDKKYVENQLQKQMEYLTENSWENIALKHIEIFENG
jgi:glycosyltransferase involved in cell wall biosynthesis